MTATKTLWPQWVAAAAVTLVGLQIGCIGTWSSPYLAKLTSENSTLPLTRDEASWVGSIINAGRIVGAIVGGVFVYWFGTKKSLLITSVPIAICWILTGIANSVVWLYIARILAGVSIGMAYSSFPLYIGEIADPAIRGCLVSVVISGLAVGTLLASIIGAYFDLVISSSMFLALSIVPIIMFALLPESPHHLMRLGNTEKIKASITWYDRNCNVDTAFSSLKSYVEIANSQSFFEKMKEFKRVELRKALFITLMLFVYRQFCGVTSIAYYMEIILEDGKSTIIPPSTTVIIVSAITMGASVISMYLIDFFGRRVLLIISSTGISIGLTILGIHFTLLDDGYDSTKLEILPIAALIIFRVSACAGVLTVPSTVLSEIFPPAIKCVAACTASIADGLFAFTVSKTFLLLVATVGHRYVYWIYLTIILTAVPFALLCLPETKGKSLQEIQDKIRVKK